MATVRLLPNFLKYSLERVLPTSLEALQRDYDALLAGTTDASSFKPNILYGRKEAAAYTAFRFGPVFSVQEHIYGELKERLPDFRPRSVLDFGAGPGQTQWAVNYAFDDDGSFARATEDPEHAPAQADNAIHFTCVEESLAMQDMGKELCRPLKHLSRCISWYPSIRDVFEKHRKDFDMAVVSYTLDDMASANAQDAAVRLCWEDCPTTVCWLSSKKQLRAVRCCFTRAGRGHCRRRGIASKIAQGPYAKEQSIDFFCLAQTLWRPAHMAECPVARGGVGPGDMMCRFPIRVETPYSAHTRWNTFRT